LNVLLTGGAGYIGSHTATGLLEAGYDVVLLDNFCNSHRAILERIEKIVGKSVQCIDGDVRDTALVKKALQEYGVEVVIHLAGLKAVGESVKTPLNYYENNVHGTLSLLRAMDEADVNNMIFSSSATVYGDPQYLPIDENHPVAPTNPYGRTKLFIEQILEDHVRANNNIRVVNLRYFNPVGSHISALLGEDPIGTPNNLMPFMARVASGELKELSVFGNDYPTMDGTGVRDYIHVVDLAEGHVAALAYLPKSTGFETFNLGTGSGFSVLQVIQSYEAACGKKIPYQIVKRRPGDIASCYTAPNKANAVLKWKANRSLSEMCLSSWDFQRRLN
jgi:UDP-glucose 4-epimerase